MSSVRCTILSDLIKEISPELAQSELFRFYKMATELKLVLSYNFYCFHWIFSPFPNILRGRGNIIIFRASILFVVISGNKLFEKETLELDRKSVQLVTVCEYFVLIFKVKKMENLIVFKFDFCCRFPSQNIEHFSIYSPKRKSAFFSE